MDEACNIAAELSNISLPVENYWTGLVSRVREEHFADSSSSSISV